MKQHNLQGPFFVDIEPRRVDENSPYDAAQISIQTAHGFNYSTYIKPEYTSPGDYSRLGFPPNMLAVSPTLDEVSRQVDVILRGQKVFCWNVPTEQSFLPILNETDSLGNPLCQVQDLMWWAAPLVTKEWSHKHGTWKFPKQTAAAEAFGLTYDDPGPHDAGADASMMIKIYKKLLNVDISWKSREESGGVRLVWDGGQNNRKAIDFEADIPF